MILVDTSILIGYFKGSKGIYNENIFNLVKVSYDSIEWPNGIDLDPEVLYEKSKILLKDNV